MGKKNHNLTPKARKMNELYNIKVLFRTRGQRNQIKHSERNSKKARLTFTPILFLHFLAPLQEAALKDLTVTIEMRLFKNDSYLLNTCSWLSE